MVFQDNLKKYRELAGYESAKEFSDALNIPYPTYIAYENRGREPKYELLIKIAKKLDVTTDELLGIDSDEQCITWEHAQKILRRAGIEITYLNDAYVQLTATYLNDTYTASFRIKNLISLIQRMEQSTKKSSERLLLETLAEIIANYDSKNEFYFPKTSPPENN